MICEWCKEPAKVLSFCYDEFNQKDGEIYLCNQCHSFRVDESQGIFYNFIGIKGDGGK